MCVCVCVCVCMYVCMYIWTEIFIYIWKLVTYGVNDFYVNAKPVF